ncbi:pollen receptor-like kinase 3 [Argentina anserina]|uniref:pollen receptor-like kinase 3 n=1 Tax=Argentina anserina TaxID=57926 RepID=UPI00217640DB|nr:pollen receptor-like kinase 3 [Potentilla anserina]
MAAAAGLNFHRPYLLLSIIFLSLSPLTYSISDAEALLKFKQSLTNADALDSWVPNSAPCANDAKWAGLVCFDEIVTGLRLGGMGLSGTLDFQTLNEVKGLRTMSVVNNNFSGSIPDFNIIGPLKAIYLSGNAFSGEIPSDFFTNMDSLKRVWLDRNKFSGKIPASLGETPNLQVLHLENNEFSGSIPELSQVSLTVLNVSNNKLEGEIPKTLAKFDETVFSGNSGLCGQKVGKDCNNAAGWPIPTPSPTSSNGDNEGSGSSSKRKKGTSTIVIALSVTCAVVLLMLILLLFVRSRRKKSDENLNALGTQNTPSYDRPPPQQAQVEAVELNVAEINNRERELVVESPASVSSAKKGSAGRKSTSSHAKGVGGMPELVMLNEEKGVFGLTDLMKAAAEVLGNGGMGSSYKAVLANGFAVVVKRIREMNAMSREGFDAEMKRLGTLRHWNILTPLAYHYRKEEKLLVYEHIPNSSLLYLLHGDRGSSHDQLNWPARLKIIQGTARGMGFIHTEFSGYDLPHGDLKSSNVLIGLDYQPLLSEFGFAPMINSSHLPQALFAYKAPEASEFGQVSPKCDVFCLGVLILETLTGKFPSQYLSNGKGGTDVVQWVRSAISERRELELLDPEISNEQGSINEMEKLLHIGAACTENDPRQRLDMMEAIRRIEQIKAVGAGEEAARTVQVLPSLRDGYADSSLAMPKTTHAPTLREGVTDISESAAAETEISRLPSRSYRSRSG